ncbi:1,2-phenylacetyl-CoA epoxidase subunit PaaC [Allosphingosinicella indica]|uniref:Ring-1,2-phenylacetyl-CoA epoxidase subunit PaaC n=1 Tax=Allosphingosinicella indica TaxID=941907 RepID=A0A1X7H1F9_9SPHN|nr:1,2-phenylacetyl-CoA epoxidase subunit PaaC [Allosphingosinicella indica]SMF77761.1 ring-1,2-phenylacetyl-CoA epoxidase subunit PaaC [Allosphingosinicella indica]
MPSLPTIEKDVEAKAARAPDHGAFDAPVEAAHRDALFDYLCRLGDDSLILGHRLGEWCGHAPAVEVDLSLANMALDLVGQATHFLNAAGALEGKGRDGDALAFRRDVLDFRNCLLVEQPNGDFAQTMARQFYFSTWQHLLFDHLTRSSYAPIADVAAKAVKEVAYHRVLSAEWVVRLGDGTHESRARMIAGLDWMARFVPELFESDGTVAAMAEAGIGVDPAVFRSDYESAIGAVLAEATLDAPPAQRPILGGRRGHHSEHLGHLLCVMQFLPRTYPDATW